MQRFTLITDDGKKEYRVGSDIERLHETITECLPELFPNVYVYSDTLEANYTIGDEPVIGCDAFRSLFYSMFNGYDEVTNLKMRNLLRWILEVNEETKVYGVLYERLPSEEVHHDEK